MSLKKAKKVKKFKKFNQKLWASASGGILAGMMLVGANPSYAQIENIYYPQEQTEKSSRMHMMHNFNSLPKVSALAGQLGISSAQVKKDLRAGKTAKQIFREHGIALDELQKAIYS